MIVITIIVVYSHQLVCVVGAGEVVGLADFIGTRLPKISSRCELMKIGVHVRSTVMSLPC